MIPGQKVALVGPTGCGKSSTIRLIQRFYSADKVLPQTKGQAKLNLKNRNLFRCGKIVAVFLLEYVRAKSLWMMFRSSNTIHIICAERWRSSRKKLCFSTRASRKIWCCSSIIRSCSLPALTRHCCFSPLLAHAWAFAPTCCWTFCAVTHSLIV